jgi:hypothetical protein
MRGPTKCLKRLISSSRAVVMLYRINSKNVLMVIPRDRTLPTYCPFRSAQTWQNQGGPWCEGIPARKSQAPALRISRSASETDCLNKKRKQAMLCGVSWKNTIGGASVK